VRVRQVTAVGERLQGAGVYGSVSSDATNGAKVSAPTPQPTGSDGLSSVTLTFGSQGGNVQVKAAVGDSSVTFNETAMTVTIFIEIGKRRGGKEPRFRASPAQQE